MFELDVVGVMANSSIPTTFLNSSLEEESLVCSSWVGIDDVGDFYFYYLEQADTILDFRL